MSNNNKLQNIKDWWESDTAKAVSTIIAVLLIPAAVLAWNYASSRDVVSTADQNSDEMMNGSENANQNEDGEAVSSDLNGITSSTETQNNTSENASPSTTDAQANNQTGNAVGGINDVNRLPNTSTNFRTTYAVKNGDNVYKISMNVCGNNSFYVKNMNTGYLKIGEVLTVECQ